MLWTQDRLRSTCRGMVKGMGYFIRTEIKNHMCQARFFVGLLVLFAAAVISEHFHVQVLLDNGSSTEGPGWFAAYSYYIYGDSFLLFLPVTCALAVSGAPLEELRSRFALSAYIRAGKRRYFTGKILGLGFGGGLLAVLCSVLLLGTGGILAGRVPASGDQVSSGSLLLTLLAGILCNFLNGALWSIVGSGAALLSGNLYLAYACPFILYYVLTVFQERYYRNLFFLSPRYLSAPLYYNVGVCICMLFVLCAGAGLLLRQIWQRRLSSG